jgi:hypothetical protein
MDNEDTLQRLLKSTDPAERRRLASEFIARMDAAMREWAPYKAKWARKRVPRYLAKGGIRK